MLSEMGSSCKIFFKKEIIWVNGLKSCKLCLNPVAITLLGYVTVNIAHIEMSSNEIIQNLS